MGHGALYDLARNESVEEIICADINKDMVEKVANEFGSKVQPVVVDAAKKSDLTPLFKEADAVISCISYKLNLLHTKVAIDTGTHLCDLGGNIDIVKQQLELHEKAKNADVTIVPDCGLAPGMVSVLARAGIDYLTNPESVKIRVGGLQQEPKPPLNYSLIFSVEGLINEYIEPCMVLRDGKIEYEDPLIGFEQIDFPPPYGTLEAFNTSGGTSTLPLTYEGKVKELNYKTIRYPGHGHKMWTLMQLGLMDDDEYDFKGVRIAPRVVLEQLLEERLPSSGKDVTLIRVLIEGWKGTESRKIIYEVIDKFDEKSNLTSMMRTTAFPAALTATMLANGTIEARGVCPPERSIPPEPFIEGLRQRGIEISHKII
jgi:lysine 6-dehydrogenase